MLQWLPWEDAAELAAVTGALWGVTREPSERSSRAEPARWARRLHPWAKELTLVLILYGMWQYAGRWSLGRAGEAVSRGRTIWRLERAVHLPSERTVQRALLDHRSVLHWLNVYYAQVHVPALGVLLVWLFVRHRDRYPPVRTVVALVTGASLLIQLVPVAPPRLVPQLGVVDTGALVGPSDYAGGAPGIDQLSAMPSLHVAWALIVAGGVIYASRRRWRWLALTYPVLTLVTVVVTGNHYWADGMVATLLCAVAFLAVRHAYRLPQIGSAQDLVGVAQDHGAGDQVVHALVVAPGQEEDEGEGVGDDAEGPFADPAHHLPQRRPAAARHPAGLGTVTAHPQHLERRGLTSRAAITAVIAPDRAITGHGSPPPGGDRHTPAGSSSLPPGRGRSERNTTDLSTANTAPLPPLSDRVNRRAAASPVGSMAHNPDT